MLTEEKEDYLKAILNNGGATSFVTNKKLSQYLNIKPPSVSEMVNRLEKAGYVITKPYKGVKLSEEGFNHTLEIIKRHRLLELFLIEILKYNWEEVHQEAEVLEHRVSDLFVERLDSLLNYPTTCPHGGVIPRNGKFEEIYNDSLKNFEEGDHVTIRRVRDRTKLLIYLSSKSISIGDEIVVESQDDTNQVIAIRKEDDPLIILSYENAAHIFGEKLKA
ncbi:metal-dependent transcriptional regulator [Staphylococcus condimenti]|uniref:Manganese transport regulator n=1 Tax=Staphylococcus condimenti TaxID=70255 RepID=A0A143PB52_9STAP|nr:MULTISPECIES: metal-dependent transcriptional regulator [Staphylococcus]AMY05570.1 DtxR family transcriptional regulator [Staphylococcus condimenti]APR61777.1 DtxR family transcriptional regulator [Staphylococcus condimenti]MDK8645688.1 metal-dependent transcriptional regulator [Staphylococcus condimenti]OFO99447.1 DtxR family transcriptional regulator [Staphylococcus sp. HMSC065E08]PNZ62507.1 metal-dependent transcriptional regulator [Staphylococcus condimenti]